MCESNEEPKKEWEPLARPPDKDIVDALVTLHAAATTVVLASMPEMGPVDAADYVHGFWGKIATDMGKDKGRLEIVRAWVRNHQIRDEMTEEFPSSAAKDKEREGEEK